MSRISKRDVILEAIIQEYLKLGMPIGSSELQLKMNLDMSPSTIRIYLKKLSEEGSLVQLHVSSGRVPTHSALEHYWQAKIEPNNFLQIEDLEDVEESAKEYGLFCTVEKKVSDKLKELLEVGKRFLILEFDKHEVVLKHNEKVKRFLDNLIGCDIRELKKISAQVGLYELHDKLEQIFSSSYLLKEGEGEIYSIAKELDDFNLVEMLLNSELPFWLNQGIYFDNFVPSGCMAVKHNVLIDSANASLFCFGKIERDFESFLNLASQRNI